jgi:hypothetical protein
VRGNGAFTPGHIVGSNDLLIPIAFGESVIEAVPPVGEPVIITEPGGAKGGGNVAKHTKREMVTCTYGDTFTLTEYYPEFDLPAGTVVTFTGSVTGFIPGS